LNLWRRSLADWDGLLLSLRGLCGERSSGQQAPGRYTWPPRFLLLFSFFLLVLWAGDSSLLAQDSGRAEYKAGKVYRLGILHAGAFVPPDPVNLGNSIPKLLRELGYVEGRNLLVERKYAEGSFDRLPGLAAELVKLRVDAIFAVGSSAVQAAMHATTTIPIVLLSNVDPVAAGFVAGLARPGGNVTGVLITPEGTLAAKKLELLKEAVPRATRIALLLPDDPAIGVRQQVQEVRNAASSLGVALTVVEVRGNEYDTAFAAIGAGQPQALVVGAHSAFVRDRKQVIELAPGEVRDLGTTLISVTTIDIPASTASAVSTGQP